MIAGSPVQRPHVSCTHPPNPPLALPPNPGPLGFLHAPGTPQLVSGSSINFGVTKPPATSAAVGFSFTANLEAAGTGGSLIVSCAAFASDGTTAAIRTAIAQITNSAPQTFTYTLIANVANLASPGAYCDLFWSATGGAAVVVDDVVMTVNLIGSCPAP